MARRHPWNNPEMLYGMRFTLALNDRQYKAQCKRIGADVTEWHAEDQGNTALFDMGDGHKAIIVSLRDWSEFPDNEVKGFLVHEAVHVFQYAMQHIGEEKPGEEVQAYTIQNISKELFDMFDKLKGAV